VSLEPAIEEFLQRLQSALDDGSLTRLTLGKYRGASTDLERIALRPVRIRGADQLARVTRRRDRDLTDNLDPAGVVDEVRRQLAEGFRAATLFTAREEWQLVLNKRGKGRLSRGKGSTDLPVTTGHDREKQRLLDPSKPFLHGLGVTDPSGRVLPSMAAKWKQINRFVELFATDFESAGLDGAKLVRIFDFGCGKGYLTFGIHEWLRGVKGLPATVTGVELRPGLVEHANRVAREHDHEGLSFQAGDIAHHPPGAMDVMIALHACDTATDLALHTGILGGARLLMCAPCCHKEIRPQIIPPGVLQPVLRHGVHLGAEADMVTDSFRALLLEAAGYDIKVFEFISLEHTNKNRMITAVRNERAPRADAARNELAQLKEFYGIREQTLDRLLTASAVA